MERKPIITLVGFRLEIDKFINSTKLMDAGREVALAHTNLQRAKMWLGKAMGESGAPTPYPNSENPENKIIDEQAQHTEHDLSSLFKLNEDSQIARVKAFRSVLTPVIEDLIKYNDASMLQRPRYRIYMQTSVLALEEAKMWFGWALDAIANSQKKEK